MFGTNKKIQNLENRLENLYSKFDEQKSENKSQILRIQKQDFTPEQAAYALNLCTVSVSQIIDYSDLNILEQEYEAILNNLNLENFPKDEAFLDVLKQILDTITFFRIQEGDKKFIEKRYQQKMKNAIWSAVPNFGVIVAGGLNPVSIGIALASQVGIGYMNYRKQKSQNDLEYEEQKWQLERSAIEQFNALRRELFTTAWKIADNYNFPDEYRLTENQIEQYDEILMDSNLFRKYERLESIQDKFEAYPPFWYFLGNAANSIAQEFLKENSYFKDDKELFSKKDEIVSAYTKKAIDAFEKFESVNNMPLLRTDEIAASCALEHIDLLNFQKDSEKIKELLQIALKNSENKNDIKQLCAMDYLRLEDYENAQQLLKNLVAEDYNANTNAQILSQIYVFDEISNRKKNYLKDYVLIKNFVEPENLLPWPNENQNPDDLMSDFMQTQKEKLVNEYLLVIKSVLDKYTICFNRKFQTPDYNKEYDDSYFLDSDEIAEERKIEFKQKNNFADFSSIGVEYIDTLNKIVSSLQKTNLESSTNIQLINESITKNEELSSAINSVMKSEGRNELSVDTLFKIKILSAFEEYLHTMADEIIYYKVQNAEKFNDLIQQESVLENLCASENIPFPEVLIKNEKRDENTLEFSDNFINYDVFGENVKNQKEKLEKQKKQFNILSDFSKEFNRDEKRKLDFYLKGTKEYQDYFKGKKLGNTIKKLYGKGEIIAVLDDKSFSNKDLYFTANKVYKVKRIFGTYNYDDESFYSKLELSDDKKQNPILRKHIDSEMSDFYNFNEKEIDYNKLISLIKELKKYESEEFKVANKSEKNEFATDALVYFAGNVALGPLGGIIALAVKKQKALEKK